MLLLRNKKMNDSSQQHINYNERKNNSTNNDGAEDNSHREDWKDIKRILHQDQNYSAQNKYESPEKERNNTSKNTLRNSGQGTVTNLYDKYDKYASDNDDKSTTKFEDPKTKNSEPKTNSRAELKTNSNAEPKTNNSKKEDSHEIIQLKKKINSNPKKANEIQLLKERSRTRRSYSDRESSPPPKMLSFLEEAFTTNGVREDDAKSVALGIYRSLQQVFKDDSKKIETKGRSIYSNLKDIKNQKLRDDIISGKITFHQLANMTSEELMNPEKKEEQREMREKGTKYRIIDSTDSLSTCEGGYTCPNCGGNKTSISKIFNKGSLQNITCGNCGNVWKE